MLFPRTFAIGTPQKSYETISLNQSAFDQTLEPKDPSYVPNKYDMLTPKSYSCEALTDRPLQPGPLHPAIRGKCIVIAAGYVGLLIYSSSSSLTNLFPTTQYAVSINFGLEACLYSVPLSIFQDLLANDSPGNNPDKRKAQRLRTFKFPRYLIEESRQAPEGKEDTQSINIFCAFIMKKKVILVSDFSRLIRLHITSISRFWTADDLAVGSHVSCLTKCLLLLPIS